MGKRPLRLSEGGRDLRRSGRCQAWGLNEDRPWTDLDLMASKVRHGANMRICARKPRNDSGTTVWRGGLTGVAPGFLVAWLSGDNVISTGWVSM